MSGAIQCEPDKNGRILIPENLRIYAELDKEVTSIGQYSHIEIWDKVKWSTYNDDEFNEDELITNLAQYGL